MDRIDKIDMMFATLIVAIVTAFVVLIVSGMYLDAKHVEKMAKMGYTHVGSHWEKGK